MLQKLRCHVRNPWAWFAVLVIVGVCLSAGATQRKPALRVDSTPTTGIGSRSCIPLMELAPDGSFTGRVTCATDEQVRVLCESALKDYEKKRTDQAP